ncbi:S-phase kinase-associated protein 1 [Angomonas deanei]|uniref:Skp1 family, dimerisation domain containing protein, putative n=1 Tax=Angomonas deanei TaxID=59799 RepID=A0A7G2CEH8_9TRYP|nr:S-phase kinase-associated protein 1 [Angomonas deanei]CAD2217755.1 Skp1 family, dimerisation domain containing protein, putative [Angomonas deanei]|eukprot:EPY43055.1 S-phase kinase-associated protein 1 [Angomonas deanei]
MHMKYRFRTSVFGAEGNYLRVFPIPVRDIPRPMVLPLMEYLDSKDRLFVSDWDEITTVWMVKAATFLNYELLWQLASAKLTSLLKEKGVDSIRTLFGVENADFSPMEEAELRKEQPDEYAK